MVKIDATKARSEFSDLINTVRYGADRVIIERRGKDVAALIRVEDLAFSKRWRTSWISTRRGRPSRLLGTVDAFRWPM